jgi:hypothetical protein
MEQCQICGAPVTGRVFCSNRCRQKAYRLRHPHRVREQEEARKPRDRQDDPEKVYARNLIAYRLRRGTITRQPCEVCGKEMGEAHHDDYSRPAEVRWLCREHHELAHHPR